MSTIVVFQQMLVIFLLIGTGYFLFRKRMVSNCASRDLSCLITMVCNPAIILASAVDESTTATRGDILTTVGIAFVSYIVLMLLGWLMPRLLRVASRERSFYTLMTVYGNTGFIGIPVVSAVLGTAAVIYVTVFNLFFNVLIYTHGIAVLEAENGEKKKHAFWRQFLNVGTLAAVLAIVIFWFQIPLPGVLEDSLSYAGRCTTFLSMAVLGATLSQMPFREVFCGWRIYLFAVIRMVLLPVAMGLILGRLSDNAMMVGASVLVMAMPVANMPLMLAKQYGLECGVLSRGIVLTTLLSLLTIPVVSLVL
ncbi:MAG TPA: AEC family transporter [Candidatus Pullilachnospira intestinigallinarum]|nr:AEC family transporter [Candidatus Pullilachnospira intestinigallinarum]